ncbi:MAG: rod shape-determining protein MreC [Rhodospirillaceae bacterium]|nr:rod shape-determining protein MreC [Rhodospirillaceae bacterium]
MVLFAGSLIVVDRIESRMTREIRSGVADVFTPVIAALSTPFQAAAEWFSIFKSNAAIRNRNVELIKEVEQLRIALQELLILEEENKRLRTIANAGNRLEGRHFTAAVVADTGGPYIRSLIVRAGTANGLRRGMAVINIDGLVGRIVETGHHASRVLLVTDLNSRIPVQFAASGHRALLSGTNRRQMRLGYVSSDINVSVGSLIITSGHGGLLPPGIPVGRVDSSSRDSILVRPLVDWNRLNFVRIIDFPAPGLVENNPVEVRTREGRNQAERQ